MAKAKQYWLVKQEPTSYSWTQFVKDGKTAWTGVRNYQARNNLQAMALGDEVFYYHSVVGKEVVGLAKVVRTAYPDPTADEPAWVSVDLAPVKPLPKPVTLDQIKAEPELKNIGLVRNSRISVIPLAEREFQKVCAMGGMR
jgi:predicted RNA-binding protein with PUA-like domain